MCEGDMSSGDSTDPLVHEHAPLGFHEKGRAHEDIKCFYGLLYSSGIYRSYTYTHTNEDT